MNNPASTIEKLRRLAKSAGAEAETAAAILRDLEARYPDAAERSNMTEGEVSISCADEYERQVIARLAAYLGCVALRTKSSKRGPWRKLLVVRGPLPFVMVAESFAKPLLNKVREILLATACGFAWGALPMDAKDASKTGQAREMTDEQKAAARMAYGLGLGNQPRRALPGAANAP